MSGSSLPGAARPGDATSPRTDVTEFYEGLWSGSAGGENAARWSFHAPLVAQALDGLGDVRARTVLEIGPGIGLESAELVRRGARVIPLDLTQAALVRTREATGGAARPLRARAETLPLHAATVDAVFAQTVLMHLDLRAAAAEWARVLRPGGVVVVLEPLRGNPFVGAYRRILSPYRTTHPRYVTLAEIARASPELTLVHHEEHYLFAVLALGLPGAARNALRAALERVDRPLLESQALARLAWMTLAVLRRA